ncbi:DNA polymerase Y family protein, partial [Pseudomonas sp. CrR25]|nr:DNA polymerase Y family protein [Pseudomonas sp. CrR25]
MRWACVLLPQLALDDALRHCEEPDAPFALLSGPPQRRLLRAVNPAARALGLRPGQPLSAAQALSRHIATADYDSSAIERRQHFLAAWAYRFSSQVSLHYPRALLLEIESSLGLFGPWPRLEARLREELKNLGFQHRITVAPNPAAARMLANTHDGLAVPNDEGLPQTLGQLPIERSGLSREVASTLSRMGLRTLHQVLALPRASIARRFPADVLRHLDTLLGIRPLVVDCYTPPDEFDLRIELNFEVESHQALLFPLRRMLQDLATYLTGRDSGVQRFTLHLVHRALADSRVPVELLSVTREAALLFELTHERLQRLQLPAPVQALRLIARDLPAFVPERRVLFDERPQQSLAWE